MNNEPDNKGTPEWILDLISIGEEAGLTFTGLNFEGLPEFIGTDEQWSKYEDLKNNL